jgi:small subunit ribosomal protein S16
VSQVGRSVGRSIDGETRIGAQIRRENKEEVASNMVKIRMMRMGSKKRPFYRVMAIDERKQRDGRPLEFLGTYDPRIEPPAVKLDLEGIDGWVGKGAQLSGTVRSLVNGIRRSGNTAVAAAAGASNSNV